MSDPDIPPGLSSLAFALKAQAEERKIAAIARSVSIRCLLISGPDLEVRLHGELVSHARSRAEVCIGRQYGQRFVRSLVLVGWSFEPDVGPMFRSMRRIRLNLGMSSGVRLGNEGFVVEARWRLPLGIRRRRERALRRRLRETAIMGPSGMFEPDLKWLAVLLASRVDATPADLGDARLAAEMGSGVAGVLRTARSVGLESRVRHALEGDHPPGASPRAELESPHSRPIREALVLIGELLGLIRSGFFPWRSTTRNFGGIRIVTPQGVFRPWELSAELAEVALSAVPQVTDPLIAEIGTGSGLVSLTLARTRSDARVIATDVSRLALRATRRNARRLRIPRVAVLSGDLLSPLRARALRPDLVVSNLPSDPPTVTRFDLEPFRTLVGPDADGLGLVRRLLIDASNLLVPGGRLVVMLRPWQLDSLDDDVRRAGFEQIAQRASGVAPLSFYVLELRSGS